MRIIPLLIILSAVIPSACTSTSKTRQHNSEHSPAVIQFNLMNTDGDRQLPVADARDYLAAEFLKHDTDHNQLLTLAEYQASKQKHDKIADRFNGLDRNHDDNLSPEEAQIEINDFFNRYDRNHDNVVTLEEVKMGGKRKRSKRRKGRRSGNRHRG